MQRGIEKISLCCCCGVQVRPVCWSVQHRDHWSLNQICPPATWIFYLSTPLSDCELYFYIKSHVSQKMITDSCATVLLLFNPGETCLQLSGTVACPVLGSQCGKRLWCSPCLVNLAQNFEWALLYKPQKALVSPVSYGTLIYQTFFFHLTFQLYAFFPPSLCQQPAYLEMIFLWLILHVEI